MKIFEERPSYEEQDYQRKVLLTALAILIVSFLFSDFIINLFFPNYDQGFAFTNLNDFKLLTLIGTAYIGLFFMLRGIYLIKSTMVNN